MSLHSVASAVSGKGSPRHHPTTSASNAYNSYNNYSTSATVPSANYGIHPASTSRPNFSTGPSQRLQQQNQNQQKKAKNPFLSPLFSATGMIPMDKTRALQKMGRLGDKVKDFQADREQRKWAVEAGLDVKDGRAGKVGRVTGLGKGRAEGRGEGWERDGKYERQWPAQHLVLRHQRERRTHPARARHGSFTALAIRVGIEIEIKAVTEEVLNTALENSDRDYDPGRDRDRSAREHSRRGGGRDRGQPRRSKIDTAGRVMGTGQDAMYFAQGGLDFARQVEDFRQERNERKRNEGERIDRNDGGSSRDGDYR